MPIYVYRNLTTGATFEVEQRMVDPALTTDPVSGDPVKRLIQPVGIAFKGSGFYVTDSRGGKAAAKPASSPAGDAPAAASSDATPARDAKPATPPAASTGTSAAPGAAAAD